MSRTRKIVSIHSYRGGTGKSNVTANVAACAIARGKRVAILDTDLQSPGVHVIFGFDQSDFGVTLVDFLWDKCSSEDTAYDLGDRVDTSRGGRGWLVPASMTTHAISRIVEEGYDVEKLNRSFDELLEALDLDYLFIDTHPGLNRAMLLSTALSDVLVLILRPDQQDYFGTALLTEIANKLELPRVFLVANKVFSHVDEKKFKESVEKAFGHEVIGQIPLSEDLARVESRALFVRKFPDHAMTHLMEEIAQRILDA